MAIQYATHWGRAGGPECLALWPDTPLTVSARARARRVQVGSKIPAIELDHGFAGSDGVKVNLAERVKGKKVILVGLPGAFTPT